MRDRPGEDDEGEPRGPEPRVQAAEDRRQLPVAGHRVRDAGGADHAGVRGDEENGRRQHADVDLEHVQRRPPERPRFSTTPSTGSFVKPPSSGGRPEQGHPLAVGLLEDRKSRERDERQGEIDREDRGRDQLVGVRDVARRVPHLLRQVGNGLHARVGEHRHGDRQRELAPGGGDAPADVAREDVRAEDEDEPDHDEERLGGEVDDRQDDVELRRLLDAHDVDRHEDDHDDRAADDVPGVLAERLPEDREVVRDEEGRDRHGGDVDEHLRPGRPEADELVEPVPREARGSAGLRVAHRAFRIGGRGRREDHSGDDEDERRQPEGERGGDAERVVDGGADVAVGRGEERRRAEHPLEVMRAAAAARRHRRIFSEQPVRLSGQLGRPYEAPDRPSRALGSLSARRRASQSECCSLHIGQARRAWP